MFSKDKYDFDKFCRDGKVFYRDSELKRYSFLKDGQEVHYSPKRMLMIDKFYEEMIDKGKFSPIEELAAEELERKRNLPPTWLNNVASKLRDDYKYGFNGAGENEKIARELDEFLESRKNKIYRRNKEEMTKEEINFPGESKSTLKAAG